MSVFGLDSPEITSAYETAQREAGGWLLLRYTSRDALGLHAHGTSTDQAAISISSFTEKAPLYGFLTYNKSKIVCKYTPDGTSRLLQARTTVHFQSILEHFTPHDAILLATSADDFADASLAAAVATPIDDATVSVPQSPEKQMPLLNQPSPQQQEEEYRPMTSNKEVSDILDRLARRKSETPPTSQLAFQDMMAAAFAYSADSPTNDKFLGATYNDSPFGPDIRQGPGPTWEGGQEKEIQDKPPYTDMPTGTNKASSDYQRSTYPDPGRPMTSDSTSSPKKPKMRFFTRAVAEADAYYAERDARAKLPVGIRKTRETEATRPNTPKTPPRSTRRPKTRDTEKQSLHHHTRSTSSTIPFTIDLAAQIPLEKAANDIAFQSRPSQTMPPATTPVRASLDGVHGDGQAADFARTNDEPQPELLEEVQEPVTAKKSVPMTQERMRLLKAMQMRRKQQEEALAPHLAAPPTQDQHINDGTTPIINGSIKADSGIGEDHITNGLSPTSAGAQDTSASSDGGTTIKAESPPAQSDPIATDSSLRVDDAAFPTLDRTHSDLKDSLKSSPALTPLSNHSSTDSYLDELQNAHFGEALAVAVPQTPITTTNPNTPNHSRHGSKNTIHDPAATQAELYRSASKTTINGKSPIPVAAGQKLSPPTLINVSKPPASKRGNLSSGISRRIQALEERSQRSSSPSSPAPREPSNIELPASFLGAPRSSVVPNHTRNASLASRPSSRASSMTRQSTIRGLFRPLAPIDDMTPRISTELPPSHVSVTARIVRPERQRSPVKAARQATANEFQRSEVIIERAEPAWTPPPRDAAPSRQSARRTERPPSTFSARPDSRGSSFSQMVGAGRNSMDIGFKFMGRHRSESKSPTLTVKTANSMGSLEPVDENAVGKKSSRTSRFFKRMSGLSHPSRGTSIASDKPKLDSRELKTSHQHVRVSKYIVGDLNVQFPDTLFWKRRWVEVDDGGNLTLVGSQRGDTRAIPKKYHMGSFLQPSIPPPDRQELPHSVVLEFVNGGALQLASEDRANQTQVFKRLTDAHNAWSA